MDPSESMSGAQFRREVGVDPAKWAREFLAAYAQAEGVRTDADRLAFVTQWFADAQDAAVRVAVTGGPDDPDDTEPGMRA